MGRSTTFRQVIDKFDRLENGLKDANYKATAASAAFTKKAVMMQLGTTGRPIIMSRVGKKGRQGRHKVGVRYDMKKSENNVTALVRAFGNMHWLEQGTKAHWIPRGRNQKTFLGQGDFEGLRGQKATKRQRRVLVFSQGNGQVRTGPVWHEGARARRPWSKGTALAKRRTEDIFAREIVEQTRRVF